MSNFTWETEEETNWDHPDPTETAASPPPASRRWLYLLPAAALLLITALVIYNQIQRRLATTEAAMTADIISTFELAQLAAAEQDDELLTPLLSGRDQEWVEAMLNTVAAGALLDRSSFGLKLSGDPLIDSAATTFNEQLNTAELTVQHPYQDPYGRTITLERILLFRQGASRWLWSPLEDDFWGETIRATSPEGYLDLVYPHKDAAIIERLTPRIEQQIAILCADNGTLQLDCPEAFQLRLTFETDPAVFVSTTDPRFWLQTDGRLNITLPTPSLLGRPVDEAGHEALANAYAAPILTHLIVELLGYECCPNGWMMQAIIDKYLEKAQVRPYPLTQTDYGRYFSHPFSPTTFSFEARQREYDDPLLRWQSYLLIDFILYQTDSDLNLFTRQFISAPTQWPGLAVPNINPNELQERLLRFTYERSHADRLPSALPQDQTLVAMCDSSNQLWSTTKTAVQYSWQQQAWSPLHPPLENATAVAVLPDDRGLLWTDNTEKGYFSLMAHYPHQVEPLYQSPAAEPKFFSIPQTLINNNHLTVFLYDLNDTGAGNFQTHRLNCQNETCQLTQTEGLLIESPQQGHIATVDFFDTHITIQNTAGETLYQTEGTWPYVWLTEEQFVYRALTADSRIQNNDLILVDLTDITTTTLLTGQQLREMPSATAENHWHLSSAHLLPNDKNILMLSFDDRQDMNYLPDVHIIFYDWRSGAIIAELEQGNGWFDPLFSPSGRWMLRDFFDASQPDQLIDLESFEIIDTIAGTELQSQSSFNTRYDWSADGQWLAIFRQGYILLYHPATQKQHPLLYTDHSHYCYGGGWRTTP